MSPCANGTNKSSSCAKLSPAAPTKVTGSRSRVWPDCRKQFSTGRKTFSRTWRIQTRRRHMGSKASEEQRNRCRNQKSLSLIYYEMDRAIPPANRDSRRSATRGRAHLADGKLSICLDRQGSKPKARLIRELSGSSLPRLS